MTQTTLPGTRFWLRQARPTDALPSSGTNHHFSDVITVHLLAAPDWHKMFVPTVSLLELIVRGSVMYLLIFAFMRILRRETGALSTADLLVVVLVADAAQNAMASEYHSITEGAVLVATIFAWNQALDWLSFRFPAMRKLLSSPPLLLVKDGRINARNLRSEMLTKDDLAGLLREHGVANLAEVRRCYLESDGHVSVVKRAAGDDTDAPREAPVG